MQDREKKNAGGFAKDSLTTAHIEQQFTEAKRSLTTAHIERKLAESVPNQGTNNSSGAQCGGSAGQESNKKD